MTENRPAFVAGIRRRALVIVIGVIAPLAVLGMSSSGLATEHHPTGEFERFSDCPLDTSTLNYCIIAETIGGEVTIGKRTVPISRPTILQGGFIEEETGLKVVGAEDGNTLSKTPQPVPGGLLGVVAPEALPKWLQAILNKLISEGLGEVTATTE